MKKPIQAEITREQNLAKLLRIAFLVLSASGLGIVVFYLFNFSVGGETLTDKGFYYFLLAMYIPASFLILPARKKDKRAPWYDLVAASIAFGISIYFFLHAWEISTQSWNPPSQLNFVFAVILCLLACEGARRTGGFIYFVVVLILALYPLYAGHMPGMLFGASFPFESMIGFYAFGSEGLIGMMMHVLGDILIGFLLFAGVLMGTGAAKFFLDLALGICGRFRGGPAKVAVISSAFLGSISGSIVGNVVGTGSVTIPAMNRLGYPAEYAGAIEACASTGGVLMPPVMGSTAFIMAVLLGITYADVMLAAFIPSVFYYLGLLMQVDAFAAKVGLRGLPKEEIPPIAKTLKEGWPFIFVLVFLVWGLLYMRWGATTPFYASGLMILLSFLKRKTMMTPRRIVETLTIIGRLITQTAGLIVPIGLAIGGLVITGSTSSFAAGFVALGGGQVLLILLMGTIACYIMGMAGMIAAAYIFLAVTLAPALIEVGGLNPIAVHLFIIYYSMLAAISAPVAPAAFVGAAIAGANPLKTALRAMRLGIVIYIIPIFFLFNPALVLQGSFLEILCLLPVCTLGIVFISAGIEGYLVKVGQLGSVTSKLLVLAGVLITFPEWKTTTIGSVLALYVIAATLRRRSTSGP